MKKYFCVQLKRLLRMMLPVLLVAAILFGCVMAVYDVMTSLDEESEVTAKYKVGVVGTANDIYLQLGLKAMASIDSSRFSIEMVEMEEKAAEEAMRRGKISAFVVFPEKFLDTAFRGEIIPLKFVCAVGSIGLLTMIKDELTGMIETMLVEAQRGIYGSGDAMEALGLNGSPVVHEISIQYAELVFRRANMYKTSKLGSFDGLGMEGYLVTGLCIVMFMLICLTFAPMMIRRDHALSRMLCARGRSVTGQVLCDFGVYLIGLSAIAGVILLYLIFWMEASLSLEMLLHAFPVIFTLGAMSFMMYQVASDMVSGVLLQFFVTLALCFISGCLYPITFFPEAVQVLSGFLPTGLARMQIANCMTEMYDGINTLALLGYGALFLIGAVLLRRIKTAGVRG